MEGEIVFFEQRDLDQWRPRPHGLIRELQEDTISPLGQLYAEWNAVQRRTIDEYDRRRRAVETYHREESEWTPSSGDAPAASTSRPE